MSADDAAPHASIEWRVGKDFQRQLQLPVGISWAEMPLRQGLAGLAENQRVAIWLDRRVDPDHATKLSIGNVPLQVALQQVAAKLNIGVGLVGNVVYLGPTQITDKLATLAALKREAADKLPAEVRAQWRRSQPFQWEMLTSPRDLLERVTAEIKTTGGPLKVVQSELLVHDLWAAGDFPSLPPTDRLTLLLAGFDLSFDLARDGSAIRITPLPVDAVLTRSFSPDNALRAEQQLAREFPRVTLERHGNRLTATGRFEDLELIDRLLRGETVQAPIVAGAETRFDLKVDNTQVAAIINTLKKQRNLTVKVDPAVSDRLATLVTFDVQQATLAELLEAALHPAGIAFQLEGNTLELRPARQP